MARRSAGQRRAVTQHVAHGWTESRNSPAGFQVSQPFGDRARPGPERALPKALEEGWKGHDSILTARVPDGDIGGIASPHQITVVPPELERRYQPPALRGALLNRLLEHVRGLPHSRAEGRHGELIAMIRAG